MPSQRLALGAAAAVLLAWSSLGRAESPAPAPRDRTPDPNLFFFDLATTIELAPTRAVPPPMPTRVFAGATASFGVRGRVVSLPPAYHHLETYRAFGVGTGIQGTALSGRLAAGPLLRLSWSSFEEESPRRQLPDLELYGFASPWVGVEDLGGTSWAFASGSRFGVGVTALAWSSAVMRVFGCGRASMGDGPPIGAFLCVVALPVWGPVALLNHAEVFADMAYYRSQPVTPRVGFSFGGGF